MGRRKRWNLDKLGEDLLPGRDGFALLLDDLWWWDPSTCVEICLSWVYDLGALAKLPSKVQSDSKDPRKPSAQETLSPLVPGSNVRRIHGAACKLSGVGLVVDGEVETCYDTSGSDDHGDIVAVGVSPGLVGQVVRGVSLGFPADAEAEVEEEDGAPDEEDDGTDDGDEPVKDG